jgi:hypothetical protein
MKHHTKILIEVGVGVLDGIEQDGRASFTSRQFGECLHDAQKYLPVWDRYPKPLRRGHTAGYVLRVLRERGLVIRTPRAGRWQRA